MVIVALHKHMIVQKAANDRKEESKMDIKETNMQYHKATHAKIYTHKFTYIHACMMVIISVALIILLY